MSQGFEIRQTGVVAHAAPQGLRTSICQQERFPSSHISFHQVPLGYQAAAVQVQDLKVQQEQKRTWKKSQ